MKNYIKELKMNDAMRELESDLDLESTDWIDYDGTEFQLKFILDSNKSILVDSKMSCLSRPNNGKLGSSNDVDNIDWLRFHFKIYNVKKFLLCNSHPFADMMIQQAQTGQPVWVRFPYHDWGWDKESKDYLPHDIIKICKTWNPNWYIPKAEYSFTEFNDETNPENENI